MVYYIKYGNKGNDFMPIPFDSQRKYYRTPFGAVEQETTVHLRVLAPRDLHSKYVELCVKYDYDYNW